MPCVGKGLRGRADAGTARAVGGWVPVAEEAKERPDRCPYRGLCIVVPLVAPTAYRLMSTSKRSSLEISAMKYMCMGIATHSS